GKSVAFVSGPRTVMYVLSLYLDTTISQPLMAIERKEPVRSLCARQIRSTKGESDSLSSIVKSMFLHHRDSDGIRPQLAAFFTSALIRASSAAVNSFSAKATGHIGPSSRFAASLKPNVEYLVLNFSE